MKAKQGIALWWCLKEEQKIALQRLYKELEGKEYRPPPDMIDERGIKLDCDIETGQELEKEMQTPTKWKRRPR